MINSLGRALDNDYTRDPPAISLHQSHVEVIVSFGHSVLKVAHIDPHEGFSLGQSAIKETVNMAIDAEVLGQRRLDLIHVGLDDAVYAVIPARAEGHVTQGKQVIPLADLRPTALCAPTDDAAVLQRLGRKLLVEYDLGAIHIKLQLVPREDAIRTGYFEQWDREVPLYFAASCAAFLSLMAAMAFFSPPLGLEDESELDRKRLVLISQYLDAASEREQESQPKEEEESSSGGGTAGKRAEGPEGEAGKPDHERVQARVVLKGPRDNPQMTLRREALLLEATQGGMIGLLSGASMDNALAHPIFGRDEALGNMDLTAQGKLWGDEIGESGGMGGLGLSGEGFGGGLLLGNGIGMGIGHIGTIGGGTGKDGLGLGHGRPSGHHQSKGPQMRTNGETSVSGRLPPQVIQRVVRQNFGRFRLCYEQGLARNPNLEGRVSVRFIIGSDGGVSTVSAGGDLPDQGTKSCVATAFYGISFPTPKDGIVTVSYPLMFTPE